MLGVVGPVGQLHHGPRVLTDVLLEGPGGRTRTTEYGAKGGR